METKNSAGAITEGLIDIYKKQVNLMFDVYNNIFSTWMKTSNENVWNPMTGFTKPFLNGDSNGDGSSKAGFTPFFWMKQEEDGKNPFQFAYGSFLKRSNDFNRNWLSAMQNNFHLRQNYWDTISENYKDAIENQLHTFKDASAALNSIYAKQLDLSIDAGKKMLSELNKQISDAIRSNEELWKEYTKVYDAPVKEEKEEKNKKPERKEAERV